MGICRKGLMFVLLAGVLGGCASLTTPPYSPDYEAIDRLKEENTEKLAVGKVQPDDPAAPVNKITLRGITLKPQSGTFANYLEDAIRTDLMEMGVYNPAAATRIDMTIVKNDIDVSGISTGYGAMEVKLTVNKSGSSMFEKTYATYTQFDSSFLGSTALAKGQSEYPNLVRTLLQKIYGDPSFINAVRK